MRAARLSDLHRFDTPLGAHILVADESRIYDLPQAVAQEFDTEAAGGEEAAHRFLARNGLQTRGRMGDTALTRAPPMRSLSLAVAQSCNLGCGYCYAQQGSFGAAPAAMSRDVARDAVEKLIGGTPAGERVQIAFLGGEPLANRTLIRQATEHAVALGRSRSVRVSFAITTNGTLLRPDDAAFFAAHRFAVTVSLDGTEAQHDRQRGFRNGAGSYRRIVENLQPFFALPELDLSARVTVTPENLDLPAALLSLLGLGFRSVGFSPMLSSPNGAGALQTKDVQTLLEQMIACGRLFVENALAGEAMGFENMRSALAEIHRGTHRPYPCGAGAGYFGVSAEGGLFACHRFVGDAAGSMGNLRDGVDRAAQQSWLAERAVDRQEPCNACWARYLCGGGCHHEVIHRGRPACDYIRGWLDFCLAAYVSLSDALPGYFDSAQ